MTFTPQRKPGQAGHPQDYVGVKPADLAGQIPADLVSTTPTWTEGIP